MYWRRRKRSLFSKECACDNIPFALFHTPLPLPSEGDPDSAMFDKVIGHIQEVVMGKLTSANMCRASFLSRGQV